MTSQRKCWVPTCRDGADQVDKTFFCLPQHLETRELWIAVSGKPTESIASEEIVFCQEHFLAQDLKKIGTKFYINKMVLIPSRNMPDRTCRTCMSIIPVDQSFHIVSSKYPSEMPSSIKDDLVFWISSKPEPLHNIFKFCMPELKIPRDPCQLVCNNCFHNIWLFFVYKLTCIEVEKDLKGDMSWENYGKKVLCRSCIQTAGTNFIPLPSQSNMGILLQKMFVNDCVSSEIVPLQVCLLCYNVLEKLDKFSKNCHEVEEKMKRHIALKNKYNQSNIIQLPSTSVHKSTSPSNIYETIENKTDSKCSSNQNMDIPQKTNSNISENYAVGTSHRDKVTLAKLILRHRHSLKNVLYQQEIWSLICREMQQQGISCTVSGLKEVWKGMMKEAKRKSYMNEPTEYLDELVMEFCKKEPAPTEVDNSKTLRSVRISKSPVTSSASTSNLFSLLTETSKSSHDKSDLVKKTGQERNQPVVHPKNDGPIPFKRGRGRPIKNKNIKFSSEPTTTGKSNLSSLPTEASTSSHDKSKLVVKKTSDERNHPVVHPKNNGRITLNRGRGRPVENKNIKSRPDPNRIVKDQLNRSPRKGGRYTVATFDEKLTLIKAIVGEYNTCKDHEKAVGKGPWRGVVKRAVKNLPGWPFERAYYVWGRMKMSASIHEKGSTDILDNEVWKLLEKEREFRQKQTTGVPRKSIKKSPDIKDKGQTASLPNDNSNSKKRLSNETPPPGKKHKSLFTEEEKIGLVKLLKKTCDQMYKEEPCSVYWPAVIERIFKNGGYRNSTQEEVDTMWNQMIFNASNSRHAGTPSVVDKEVQKLISRDSDIQSNSGKLLFIKKIKNLQKDGQTARPVADSSSKSSNCPKLSKSNSAVGDTNREIVQSRKSLSNTDVDVSKSGRNEGNLQNQEEKDDEPVHYVDLTYNYVSSEDIEKLLAEPTSVKAESSMEAEENKEDGESVGSFYLAKVEGGVQFDYEESNHESTVHDESIPSDNVEGSDTTKNSVEENSTMSEKNDTPVKSEEIDRLEKLTALVCSEYVIIDDGSDSDEG